MLHFLLLIKLWNKLQMLFRYPTSIKKLHRLTGLVESTMLYKSMEPKQINISEEKVTEIIEQEYKNQFNIYMSIKKN